MTPWSAHARLARSSGRPVFLFPRACFGDGRTSSETSFDHSGSSELSGRTLAVPSGRARLAGSRSWITTSVVSSGGNRQSRRSRAVSYTHLRAHETDSYLV